MVSFALRFWPRALAFVRAVGLGSLLVGLGAFCRADGISPELAESSFAPKSGPRGITMFTPLPPEQTGITVENRYDDPRMWGERYLEFSVGAIGTGVAAGDYDGDGRPDLLVVSKVEGCRLFRNLGNWKFEDVTAKAGLLDKSGVWKQGATFVDVNNDGRPDIYVCRFGAPNFLYINQGDGTFKEEAAARGLAISDACGMAEFCDYDRDGRLDVYIHTNLLDTATHPNGQPGHLLHNNGNGTFTEVTARAGIHGGETQSHSATWWDYDNDGWPDLYVANDFDAPDVLYHNNRDGTFTDTINQTVPHMPLTSMGADLGDVNNDGLIDLIVADMAATTHEQDQRGMAESRARIKTDAEPGVSPQFPRSALYLNTGTGRMQEAAILAGLAATDWTWSVRLEDFDNDGRLDLHVTNGMNREQNNTDLVKRMMGAESAEERVRLMRTSPLLKQRHLAFRNRGDLEFEDVSAAWGLNQIGVGFGAATADFDGDGDLDLVFTNYQGNVTVLRNDCDTGHSVILALHGTKSNSFGVGATARIETASGKQVRQLVLARGYDSSSEPIMHFGLGADVQIKQLEITWPSGCIQRFTDLPADRKFTITEPADAMPAVVLTGPPAQFTDVSEKCGLAPPSKDSKTEDSTAQLLQPIRFARPGSALAIGAVGNEGRDNLLIGGDGTAPIRRLPLDNPGTVELEALIGRAEALPLPDGPLLVFDADGDGHDDVLVTKAGAFLPTGAPGYQPTLLLNDGRGGLHPAADGNLPELRISCGAAVAADFNRDGHLDVFIGARVLPGYYPLPPRSALLQNEGGKFVDVTDSLAPGLREVGMITSALWSDVDGDGWPDLLLTLEWGHVKYFHSNQGKGFEDWTEKAGFAAAGTGWWNSIAAADFNGDGRPDYVVGNLGLNNAYNATHEHPALLFYCDLGGSDGPCIMEGAYEGDRLYPTRSRKELARIIPSLLKRYPKNDAFAKATLAEIAGEENLARAQRFAATEFRSGVFLSRADGTYKFEPLPRIAQISPAQGIVAGDFDGDGHADIFVVQNNYAADPAIGRFDGGLGQLLRGDGQGGFIPVPVAESGLLVPGDAKALVTADIDDDGWPDFIVSRNDGPNLIFRNLGVPDHRSLRVALRGPAGNAHAIGSQVTVEYADGSSQTSEIYAGSGFLSQSAPLCFFGYRETNPPLQLHVRWPSGITTKHSIGTHATKLIIQAP